MARAGHRNTKGKPRFETHTHTHKTSKQTASWAKNGRTTDNSIAVQVPHFSCKRRTFHGSRQSSGWTARPQKFRAFSIPTGTHQSDWRKRASQVSSLQQASLQPSAPLSTGVLSSWRFIYQPSLQIITSGPARICHETHEVCVPAFCNP